MVRAKGYNASIKYQLVDYLSRFGKFVIGSTILTFVKTRFLPQTLTFLFFTYSTWGSSMGYFDIGILVRALPQKTDVSKILRLRFFSFLFASPFFVRRSLLC